MSFSRDDLGIQGRKKSNRILGDAAEVGHVPRLHKTARGIRHRLSYAGRIPLILLGIGIFLFGAGITGLVLWVTAGTARRAPIAFGGTPLPRTLPVVPMIPAPPPHVLEEMVEAFLAARTPGQVEPLIRGTSQRPDKIAAKLAGLETEDGKITQVKYFGPIESRNLQLESVVVDFNSGRNRLALLSPDPAGTWRVDFDAFDRHVTTDWPALLSGEPNEGTVRIYACLDNYYNGRYANDREWACYGLASPDHDTLFFGYALRGSAQHMAMSQLLRRNPLSPNRTVKRMTLDLRHTGTGDRRQFEIVRVMADDWALGNEPFDTLVDVPRMRPKP